MKRELKKGGRLIDKVGGKEGGRGVRPYHPAACDSAYDSLNGVSTHGLFCSWEEMRDSLTVIVTLRRNPLIDGNSEDTEMN